MHSRIFFALRAFFIGAIAVFVLAASLFILSFIFFSVRESDVHYLLEFGEHGIGTFLAIFPWLTLLFALALLVALGALLHNFKFGYRFPLFRIFLGILAVGIVGSVLVGLTPLHSFLLSQADNDRLPLLGPWYEQLHDSHQKQGVYRGDITSLTSSQFIISHNDTDRDSDEGVWTIVPPVGFATSTLHIGDRLYLGGQMTQGIVYAYGIRVLPKND